MQLKLYLWLKVIWMIDDDLLLPQTLKKLNDLLSNNSDTEFFSLIHINSKMKFLENLERPINTYQLPINKMIPISKLKESKHVKFLGHNRSCSILGILDWYLFNNFKREKWNKKLKFSNNKNLEDNRYWFNIDNTLIHPMVMCKAFKNSKLKEIFSVNLFYPIVYKSFLNL